MHYYVGYGSTETCASLMSTLFDPKNPDESLAVLPIANIRTYVVDPISRLNQPVGVRGTFCIYNSIVNYIIIYLYFLFYLFLTFTSTIIMYY